MILKIYPKMSGAKISKIIRAVIDAYLDESITPSEATKNIEQILSTVENRIKIRKKGEYTSTFKREMGQKRLVEFEHLYKFKSTKKKQRRNVS